MARKVIELGSTTRENVENTNDNFSELFAATRSIYTDIAELQEQMAAVQADITALLLVTEDSGWQTLDLKNGWTNVGTYDNAMFRKIGNTVYLRGLINGTAAAGKNIAQVPAGNKPSGLYQRYMCSTGTNSIMPIEVNYNGNIDDITKTVGSTARSNVSLYGISWLI